jgi:hypothetical protein
MNELAGLWDFSQPDRFPLLREREFFTWFQASRRGDIPMSSSEENDSDIVSGLYEMGRESMVDAPIPFSKCFNPLIVARQPGLAISPVSFNSITLMNPC